MVYFAVPRWPSGSCRVAVHGDGRDVGGLGRESAVGSLNAVLLLLLTFFSTGFVKSTICRAQLIALGEPGVPLSPRLMRSATTVGEPVFGFDAWAVSWAVGLTVAPVFWRRRPTAAAVDPQCA